MGQSQGSKFSIQKPNSTGNNGDIIDEKYTHWNGHSSLAKHVFTSIDLIRQTKRCKESPQTVKSIDNFKDELAKMYNQTLQNWITGLPNEHSLKQCWLNYWHSQELSFIIMDIGNIANIISKQGFTSAKESIAKVGDIIHEYCEHECAKDSKKFQLFHSNFQFSQFLIVSKVTDPEIVEQFCECIHIEVSRKVKFFFSQVLVWSGYSIYDPNSTQTENPVLLDRIQSFHELYEKTKSTLLAGIKYSVHPEKPDRRIWGYMEEKDCSILGMNLMGRLCKFGLKLVENTSNRQSRKLRETESRVIESLRQYVRIGGDVNYVSDDLGESLLMYVIKLGSLPLLQELLSYNPDCDQKDAFGNSALMAVLKSGNYDEPVCVSIADKIKYPNIPDRKNITAFVYAMRRQFWKVIDVLKKKSAFNYSSYCYFGIKDDNVGIYQDVVGRSGITVNTPIDEEGRTILQSCVLIAKPSEGINPAYEVARFVLNKGADPDLLDAFGATALHYAVQKNDIRFVKMLLEHKADCYIKMDSDCQFNGCTALQIAIRLGLTTIASVLKRNTCPSSNSSLRQSPGSGRSQKVSKLIQPKVIQATKKIDPGEGRGYTSSFSSHSRSKQNSYLSRFRANQNIEKQDPNMSFNSSLHSDSTMSDLSSFVPKKVNSESSAFKEKKCKRGHKLKSTPEHVKDGSSCSSITASECKWDKKVTRRRQLKMVPTSNTTCSTSEESTSFSYKYKNRALGSSKANGKEFQYHGGEVSDFDSTCSLKTERKSGKVYEASPQGTGNHNKKRKSQSSENNVTRAMKKYEGQGSDFISSPSCFTSTGERTAIEK